MLSPIPLHSAQRLTRKRTLSTTGTADASGSTSSFKGAAGASASARTTSISTPPTNDQGLGTDMRLGRTRSPSKPAVVDGGTPLRPVRSTGDGVVVERMIEKIRETARAKGQDEGKERGNNGGRATKRPSTVFPPSTSNAKLSRKSSIGIPSTTTTPAQTSAPVATPAPRPRRASFFSRITSRPSAPSPAPSSPSSGLPDTTPSISYILPPGPPTGSALARKSSTDLRQLQHQQNRETRRSKLATSRPNTSGGESGSSTPRYPSSPLLENEASARLVRPSTVAETADSTTTPVEPAISVFFTPTARETPQPLLPPSPQPDAKAKSKTPIQPSRPLLPSTSSSRPNSPPPSRPHLLRRTTTPSPEARRLTGSSASNSSPTLATQPNFMRRTTILSPPTPPTQHKSGLMATAPTAVEEAGPSGIAFSTPRYSIELPVGMLTGLPPGLPQTNFFTNGPPSPKTSRSQSHIPPSPRERKRASLPHPKSASSITGPTPGNSKTSPVLAAAPPTSITTNPVLRSRVRSSSTSTPVLAAMPMAISTSAPAPISPTGEAPAPAPSPSRPPRNPARASTILPTRRPSTADGTPTPRSTSLVQGFTASLQDVPVPGPSASTTSVSGSGLSKYIQGKATSLTGLVRRSSTRSHHTRASTQVAAPTRPKALIRKYSSNTLSVAAGANGKAVKANNNNGANANGHAIGSGADNANGDPSPRPSTSELSRKNSSTSGVSSSREGGGSSVGRRGEVDEMEGPPTNSNSAAVTTAITRPGIVRVKSTGGHKHTNNINAPTTTPFGLGPRRRPSKSAIAYSSPSHSSHSPSSIARRAKRDRTREHLKALHDRFSTADRAILEELRQNILARDAQFIRRRGKKHHPFGKADVPYTRWYERDVVDCDIWDQQAAQHALGSLTTHIVNDDDPPGKVLELGCGSGSWTMDAARRWKKSHFVGLDVVPLQPDLLRVGCSELAGRITWTQANFLEGLPFPNDEFDFVHVHRVALGVPEDKWDALLEEIVRVMKPGAAFEMIEEDLYFPGSRVSDMITDAQEQSTVSPLIPGSPNDSATSEERAKDGLLTSSHSKTPSSHSASVEGAEDVKSSSITSHAKDDSTPTVRGVSAPPTPVEDAARIGPSMVKVTPPVSSSPCVNPRDHSLLELIYDKTHSARFINLSPLALLTNSLPLYFKDVRTHAPISITFPPLPNPILPKWATRASASPNAGRPSFEEYFSEDDDDDEFEDHLGSLMVVNKDRKLSFQSERRPSFGTAGAAVAAAAATAASFSGASPLRSSTEERSLVRGRARSPSVSAISPISPKMSPTRPIAPIQSATSRRRSLYVSSAEILHHTQPFVILDQSRAPAAPLPFQTHSPHSPSTVAVPAPLATPEAELTLDQLALTPIATSPEENGSMPLRSPSIDTATGSTSPSSPSSLINAAFAARAKALMSTNRLPNKNFNLSVNHLNLHLLVRVQEVLACSESMWDWVLEYQSRLAKKPLSLQELAAEDRLLHRAASGLGARDGEPVDVERVGELRRVIRLRELTRAEFETLLTWFRMDMQDSIALPFAMETRLGGDSSHFHSHSPSASSGSTSSPTSSLSSGWHLNPGRPTSDDLDRRAFDRACERWERRHGQKENALGGDTCLVCGLKLSGGSGGSESPGGGNGRAGVWVGPLERQRNLSRTIRAWAAWKAEDTSSAGSEGIGGDGEFS